MESLKKASLDRDLASIEMLCHKLQTMIGQFKREDLRKALQIIEQKCSSDTTYEEIDLDVKKALEELANFKESLILLNHIV